MFIDIRDICHNAKITSGGKTALISPTNNLVIQPYSLDSFLGLSPLIKMDFIGYDLEFDPSYDDLLKGSGDIFAKLSWIKITIAKKPATEVHRFLLENFTMQRLQPGGGNCTDFSNK